MRAEEKREEERKKKRKKERKQGSLMSAERQSNSVWFNWHQKSIINVI